MTACCLTPLAHYTRFFHSHKDLVRYLTLFTIFAIDQGGTKALRMAFQSISRKESGSAGIAPP